MSEIVTLKKMLSDFNDQNPGLSGCGVSLVVQASTFVPTVNAYVLANIEGKAFREPTDDLGKTLSILSLWVPAALAEQKAKRIADARATLAQLENEGEA